MAKTSGAFVGARGFDTTSQLTAEEGSKLKAAGMNFTVRYLHSLTREEVAAVLGSGMALMGATYAYKPGYSPTEADGQLKGSQAAGDAIVVGIPRGTTLWLDLEGVTGDPATIAAFCTAFYKEVAAADFVPGIYVGAQPDLNSAQLYALPFQHYWKGQSQIYGGGQLAEPRCGWQMVQLFPSIRVADTLVDINFVQQDYKGRLPTWAVGD